MTASNGKVSAAAAQRRRVMLSNSGLLSFYVTVRASRAILQRGQAPGESRTICGCMGQVYSVRSAGAATCFGSRAMPHFGQAAGLVEKTSGSIGQMYPPADSGRGEASMG